VEGNRPPLEIVGVVEDSKYSDLREATPDFVYTPMGPRATVRTTMVVRSSASAAMLKAPIEQIMESVASTVTLNSIATMREQIDESLHQDRLVAGLSGGFSLLALVLTAVGLFGVLQFSVARRTSEIGVRMALGARPADIFRLIVGNGMTLVAIGLVIGAGGAAAAERLLRGMLFGVKGFDPVAMASVVVVLGLAAFLACYLPARRASRVDPMRALRSE
jgi:ABC-type antimicrobial peptide transport system permease subunit